MISTTKTGRLNRRKIKDLIIELIMLAVTGVILYPFLIMIFVSLKSGKEALLSPSTFPSEFHFNAIPLTSAYKQCGNTVCVPVVESIARKIKNML